MTTDTNNLRDRIVSAAQVLTGFWRFTRFLVLKHRVIARVGRTRAWPRCPWHFTPMRRLPAPHTTSIHAYARHPFFQQRDDTLASPLHILCASGRSHEPPSCSEDGTLYYADINSVPAVLHPEATRRSSSAVCLVPCRRHHLGHRWPSRPLRSPLWVSSGGSHHRA